MSAKDKLVSKLSRISYQFYDKRNPTVSVMSIDETLDTLISSEKSLVRFGDGEILTLQGKDIALQKSDDELAECFKMLLTNKYEDLLVAIPDIFSNLDMYREESRLFWEEHLFKYRKVYEKYCDAGSRYGNSFITRCYYIFQDKSECGIWFAKFRKIWDNKKITVIEGEKSHSGVGNDLFDNAAEVKRIICPSQNAYNVKDKIISAGMSFEKDRLVLLALGPAAKYIAYQLFMSGYRVIDIGNLDLEYEWYIRHAMNKMILDKNSVVGEKANRDAGYQDYLNQIVKVIENKVQGE